jgi:hypothetical protein
MALTIFSFNGRTLEFKTDNFYMEVEQILGTHKWVELADACKNNGNAAINWRTQDSSIDICVSTGIVRFGIWKLSKPEIKDDCYINIIYKLNAIDCEQAFRLASQKSIII